MASMRVSSFSCVPLNIWLKMTLACKLERRVHHCSSRIVVSHMFLIDLPASVQRTVLRMSGLAGQGGAQSGKGWWGGGALSPVRAALECTNICEASISTINTGIKSLATRFFNGKQQSSGAGGAKPQTEEQKCKKLVSEGIIQKQYGKRQNCISSVLLRGSSEKGQKENNAGHLS